MCLKGHEIESLVTSEYMGDPETVPASCRQVQMYRVAATPSYRLKYDDRLTGKLVAQRGFPDFLNWFGGVITNCRIYATSYGRERVWPTTRRILSIGSCLFIKD